MVRAGYIEYGRNKSCLLGVPQGGIASPILSNLILHELDKYIERLKDENGLKTASGSTTIRNPEYYKLDHRIQGITKLEKKRRDKGLRLDEDRRWERNKLIKLRSKIPSTIPNPGNSKVYYARYADD